MKFSKEQYIELMTFGHVERQMFVELFGPLIGLINHIKPLPMVVVQQKGSTV